MVQKILVQGGVPPKTFWLLAFSMSDESVALGMYSLNSGLENAWQSLFILAAENNPDLALPKKFLNTVESEIITSDKVRISHICGYPLISEYMDIFTPLCAPHFDIEGFDGAEYFSYFVTRSSCPIDSIIECKGFVAVANSFNSNSGMSVLRHEIEVVKGQGPIDMFFSGLFYSGSHKRSIQCIIDEDADIASIDASCYHYLQQQNPELSKQLKIIGQSIKTSSPPFVTHTNNPLCSPVELTEALNESLLSLPDKNIESLNIKKFSVVSYSDYEEMFAL